MEKRDNEKKNREQEGSSEQSIEIDRREFIVGSASLAVSLGVGTSACSSIIDVENDLDADGDSGQGDGGETDSAADGDPGADADESVIDAGHDGTTGNDDGVANVRVVDVYNLGAVGSQLVNNRPALDQDKVTKMLHDGLLALTGQSNLPGCWSQLIPNFDPNWKIGIKVNCRNYRYLPNSPELVGALISSMVDDLGAKRSNFVVWESRGTDLTNCGMTSSALGGGVTVKGADSGSGYDSVSVGGSTISLSKILTDETDFTLNVSQLKHHYGAGVTGAFKNLAFGAISSPRSFHNGHDPQTSTVEHSMIPKIFNLDIVKERMLNLYAIEGFCAIRDGGPDCAITDVVGRILLSTDPVALDSYEVEIINGLRSTAGKSDISSSLLTWISTAENLGLGTTDYEVISI